MSADYTFHRFICVRDLSELEHYSLIFIAVTFTSVEQGDHTLYIAYNYYEGEQQLTLEGYVEEFHIGVTVKEGRDYTSMLVGIIIGSLITFVLFIAFGRKLLVLKK